MARKHARTLAPSTFITGVATDGVTDYRMTVRRIGAAYALYFGDTLMGDPNAYRWTTVTAYEHAVTADILSDGRKSFNAVNAYYNSHDRMVGTDRKGRTVERGRFRAFGEMAMHLLNTSDATYARTGETYDDRLNELVAITNQEVWPEVEADLR